MDRRDFLQSAAVLGVSNVLPVGSAPAGNSDAANFLVSSDALVDRRPLKPNPANLYATAKRGMISTSHALASEAGVEAMRKGGTAVDAYLTAAAVQCVVEPQLTCFAGALGLTHYDAKTGLIAHGGGGLSMPKEESNVFTQYDYTTARPVMVPGYVAGMHALQKRWGKLSWAEIFEPAIHIAKEGFIIDHFLWGWAYEYSFFLGRYPEGRAIWFPDGYLLSVGDRLRQPALAKTMERIVTEGPDYFFTGDWGKKFVPMVRAQGSKITAEDLTRVQARIASSLTPDGLRESERSIARGRYREYEVVASGNPLSVFALNLVEEGNLRARGRPTENADSLYYILRIMQEVWNTGLQYGPESIETVLSRNYAKQIWKLVESGPPRPYKGIDMGTCAISVIDGEGNVAVGTHTSSSSPFGTGIFVDGVAIPRVLYFRTSKLPSGISTSHMILKDGKPVLAMASPSRSFFTNILQNTINILEYGMTPWESVNQPMFGAPGPVYPGEEIETSFSDDILRQVEKRGLQLMRVNPGYIHMGSCQAIQVDRSTGEIRGIADIRRRGMAKGY